MAHSRPSLEEINEAIVIALARGRRSLVDVSQILCSSPSTVQRALSVEGTNFTRARQQIQLDIALKHLVVREPVWRVAERVVLSPDHLRQIINESTGLTPKQIALAANISATLEGWRRKGPPRYGSWLYRRQFEQWKRFDAQLQDLLGDLGPRHPLYDWAKRTLVAAERPDFRTQPFRDARRAEAERRAEMLQQLLESSAGAATSSALVGDRA